MKNSKRIIRKNLSDALYAVRSCVGRTPLSILSQVKIDNNSVRATDLQKMVIYPIPDMGLNVCVNHKELTALMAKTRQDEIDIGFDLETKKLIVDGGEYSAELLTMDSELFPEFDPPEDSEFEVLPDNFRAGIEHCLSFSSTDESRFILTGIYVKGNEVVATDGKRLAAFEIGESKIDKEVIIPASLIRSFLDMELESYCIVDSIIWFSGADGYLGGNLIEGQYVNYQSIFDNLTEDSLLDLELTKENFAGSDIVCLFNKNEEIVDVKFQSGSFTMKSRDDKGSVVFTSPLEDYKGPEVEFSVNYRFFVDSLKTEAFRLKVFHVSPGGSKLYIESGFYRAVVMGVSRPVQEF